MIHTNRNFGERVEAVVTDVEEHTDAEVIVVAAPRSGNYRDVSLTIGALFTWILIIVLTFIEWRVHPVAFVAEVAISSKSRSRSSRSSSSSSSCREQPPRMRC